MKVDLIKYEDSWKGVYDSALTTIGKESKTIPTSNWKKKILMAEHSPIRKLIFGFKWSELKYWVSVHLVRHKIGIDHFIRTQRTDRTGIDRNEIPQGAEVEHEIIVNAQAMINISRKRLCSNASPETREAWKALLETIKNIEPEIYSSCARECVYRGMNTNGIGNCPEFKCCGYNKTEEYKKELDNYWGIKKE